MTNVFTLPRKFTSRLTCYFRDFFEPGVCYTPSPMLKRNRILEALLCTCVLYSTLLKADGGFVSGGGSVVVDPDKVTSQVSKTNGKIVKDYTGAVEFFDIWERKNVLAAKGISVQEPTVSTTREGIDFIFGRISKGPWSKKFLNTARGVAYSLLLDLEPKSVTVDELGLGTDDQGEEFRLHSAFIPENTEIRNVEELRRNESNHYLIPKYPSQRVYVGYYSSNYWLFVDPSLYLGMNSLHRAAFLAHEAIYFLFRIINNETSSDSTRSIVSHAVLGTEFEKIKLNRTKPHLFCRFTADLGTPGTEDFMVKSLEHNFLKDDTFFVQTDAKDSSLLLSFSSLQGIPQVTAVRTEIKDPYTAKSGSRDQTNSPPTPADTALFDIFKILLSKKSIETIKEEHTKTPNFISAFILQAKASEASLGRASEAFQVNYGETLKLSSAISVREKDKIFPYSIQMWIDHDFTNISVAPMGILKNKSVKISHGGSRLLPGELKTLSCILMESSAESTYIQGLFFLDTDSFESAP